MSSSTAVLERCPPTLGLPTGDPAALAVECMLHITGARFEPRHSRLEGLSLTVPDPAGGPGAAVTTRGLAPIMEFIGTAVDAVVAPAEEQRADLACVEALAVGRIFPAFVFLVHFHPQAYLEAIRKRVEPKVATVWESAFGTYRANVLKRNYYTYTGEECPPPSGALSITSAAKMEAVLQEVTRALRALEQLHVLRSKGKGKETFILGTDRATTADAYAYAAVSCMVHADFSGCPFLQSEQATLRERCPALVQYAERVRVRYFEEYKATYQLRPVRTNTAAPLLTGDDALYRKGRLATLVTTGIFASLYFLIVNADVIVATLEALMEEEEEELLAEEAGKEAAASGEENQAREIREPKEI